MNGRKMAHRASSVHAAENVTENLQKFTTGDREAGQEVFPVLEVELRRLAGHCMRREGANHTLQPTALVNEAFLRIFHKARRPWSSREHFLADASRTMRRVLVDYARKHRSQKRSGERLTLESCHLGVEAVSVDVIHIHDLLDD